MYSLINWTETHPETGAKVARVLRVTLAINGELIANALRDAAYVENVYVETFDAEGNKYSRA